ncbi:hypothetical protein [Parasitella parasitica]|uniref:Rab GDP dissociation inhibitor n=1 Tax=Parasitella parasitica TaxID=35722 RepID=A0A0B7NMV4_9FUNG|nr:hypothetical protein [Parasitella parasitica]
MDRNDYYGAESASLNLTQFFDKFRKGQKAPESWGKDRDWNIDLIPKFMMANGEIVRFLTHTDVTRYLEFKQIAGSYVYNTRKVYKVPATATEALSSSLLGPFDKRRMKKFLEWVENYKDKDASTHQGLNIDTKTTAEVYENFSLTPGVQEFIGHAMALHLDNSYLAQPARDTVEKVRLYAASVLRYGKSPYLYPMYGLGDLPQAFARLSAVYGGTYMLNKNVAKLVYDEQGKVTGVEADGEVAKAKMVICDPSYVPEKVKTVGSVVRAICVLKHPIPGTHDSDSCQIVLPQGQVGLPVEDGKNDQVFVSRSYDATSHFETVCDDVHDIWKRITGEPLVLKKKENEDQAEVAA